jgi:hypothetical protein
MNSTLETFDLIQHVTESTHKLGNTLDLIITRKESTLLRHKVHERLSDHDVILMTLDIKKIPWPIKMIKCRKTRKVKIEKIKDDINILSEKMSEITELDQLVSKYNTGLDTILNKHAPEKTIRVKMRGKKPWSSEEICPDKTLKRNLENKMKRTNLTVDKQNYKHQRNKYNTLLNDLRGRDIMEKVMEKKDDPKGLFRILNRAQYKKIEAPMPPPDPGENITESFNNF